MARPSKQQKQEQQFAKKRFATASRLEKEYTRSLRQVTRQIDAIVKGMQKKDGAIDSNALQDMLNKYAQILKPWAESVAEKMIARIAKKDESSWIKLGREMGRELRKELDNAPTGEALRKYLNEQVHLITSLPIDAGKRVHKLALEGISEGRRYEDIVKDILDTGRVTESRARLIARTETARVASGLTKARAEHVGSTHYIWRTVGDADVREGHKEMNGKVCEWANPPLVNEGTKESPRWMKHGPGSIWNCRCFASPIFTSD